jgi:hypothetical protein
MSIDAPPVRLTLTQAYRNLLDVTSLLLTRQSNRTPAQDVELTRNIKGETNIKVSGSTLEDETLEECAERVAALYEQLRMRFPLESGYVGAQGGR